MDSSQRNSFLAGLGAGVVATFAFVAMMGLSPRAGDGDLHVTQSADGRTAFVWVVTRDGPQFVAKSRTGRDDADRANRGEGGKGKGKGKDEDG